MDLYSAFYYRPSFWTEFYLFYIPFLWDVCDGMHRTGPNGFGPDPLIFFFIPDSTSSLRNALTA